MREIIGLLDAYEAFISLNYKMSKSIQVIFVRTGMKSSHSFPSALDAPCSIAHSTPTISRKLIELCNPPAPLNPNITRIIENVRAAQPAVVLIDRASGCNLNSGGTILTNAHVAKELKRVMKVQAHMGTPTTLRDICDVACK